MRVHLAFNHRGINHDAHGRFWKEGVQSIGWQESEIEKADVTVMWGPNQEFDITRARGKPVLMCDFPYWNRGGKARDGTESYKVSLNGQHPTDYIFQEKFGPLRYKATNGPEIRNWRENVSHILIAGMGIKACSQYGYSVSEWEARQVAILQKHTNLPLIYRPKPRQRPVHVIPGTLADDADRPIENILEGAHAVVCHHGNATVTALAMGVPIFMRPNIGVATHFASFDCANIMQPVFRENRQQFFNNLAYWQWSVAEIKSGAALLSYKERGWI